MFERFTEGARQVIVLAQDEARELKHAYIGTEHLLLGLLRNEERLAARVLTSLGITLDAARARVVEIVGEGAERPSGQIPFTPSARKVLELSLRDALSLGHNYIGTEHILLGLVREGDEIPTRILLEFGADAEKVRNEVIRMLSGPGRRRAGVKRIATSGDVMSRRPVRGWEFRVERWRDSGNSELRDATLSELGADGWQLAAVVPGESGLLEWIFQRPNRLRPAWSANFRAGTEEIRQSTVAGVETRLIAAQVADAASADAIGGILRRLAELMDAVAVDKASADGSSLTCGALLELVERTKGQAIKAGEFEQAAVARTFERKLVALLREIMDVLGDAGLAGSPVQDDLPRLP